MPGCIVRDLLKRDLAQAQALFRGALFPGPCAAQPHHDVPGSSIGFAEGVRLFSGLQLFSCFMGFRFAHNALRWAPAHLPLALQASGERLARAAHGF
jgi:hypothetical protein